MAKLTVSKGCFDEIARALLRAVPEDELDAYIMPDGSLDMDRVTLCAESAARVVAKRAPFMDYLPAETD